MSGPSLTGEMIARTSALHGSVPEAVMQSARLHLLDAVGVGLLGARRGPLRTLAGLADDAHGGGGSGVFGSRSRVPAPVAALLNGSYLHSLEFDDTHVASVMHGSSTVAAAALAEAEASGADGAAMLSAYALGWEVLIRMGLASPGTLQARGFQTTSAAGPFVAALVSTLVRGDDPRTAAHALGIAGSQPGGTFAFLADGSTVKAGQPAWAAHSGLWAAALARAGMTGPARVLEGPTGFYELYAGDAGGGDRLRAELETLGTRWHLPDAAFKLLPCCHFIHPFVEALSLLLDDGLEAARIQGIHCFVPRGVLPIIAEPWAERQRPRTPHQARWSLPYVLAGRVVDGEVGLDLFEDPIGGARAELAQRITFEPWDGSGYPARYPARLVVRTTDGDELSSAVHDVLGGPGRPLGVEQVVGKARRNLTAAGLDADGADAVVRELTEVGSPDLQVLRTLLDAAAPGDQASTR